MTDALEQLLGYLTWRDTKAALLMFNRNRIAAMVKRMAESAAEHPNCKRGVTQATGTRFRYIFASTDDSAREIVLTVMTVNVPNPSTMTDNAGSLVNGA